MGSERVVELAERLSEVLSAEGVSSAEVALVAEAVSVARRGARRVGSSSWRSLCSSERVLESVVEFLSAGVSAEEHVSAELPVWALSSSGEARVFSLSEAREEVAVALDLPRDWSEVPALADCVDALTNACFVESSSCPSSLSWREDMLDPMGGAWSSAVESSGILSVLELVES